MTTVRARDAARRPEQSGTDLAVSAAQVLICSAATMLTAAPWLRAFPASVGASSLLGAACVSVLLAAMTARRRLVVATGISLVALLVFTMLVALRAPTDFASLQTGLVHGPAELLTFALPLVSPRALLVDPVLLTWLCGAVATTAVTRRWSSTMPHVVLLTGFGLSYAATQRAAGADAGAARWRETLLALGLLACLLLLRAAQARPLPVEGVRPARNLLPGAIATVVVAGVAALTVQAPVFGTNATEPQRQPTVQNTTPLSPLAFVAGLRPDVATDPGTVAFTVSTSRPTTGYFSIANVDSYDGAGWSFDRTFRPSGGVVPADADVSMPGGVVVDQTYRINSGPLAASPWLVYQPRPQRVDGLAVNVDAGSGMVVPARPLDADRTYTVQSEEPPTTFDRLDPAASSADTSTPAIDTQVPATLRGTLDSIVTALSTETNTASTSPLAFLQALQHDFRTHYALAGTTTPPSAPPSAPVSAPRSASSSASSSASASGAGSTSQRAGGTGFADVLASILGPQRTATPEQYATLTALLARDLGIPARVVSGFRVSPSPGSALLPGGDHVVRTSQAWTWTEVAITGVGWVVLDSSPTTFRTPAQDQTSGAAASPSPTPAPASNALITTGNGGNAVAHRSAVPQHPRRHTVVVLVVVLVLLGVLVFGLAVLVLRKRVRAHRRRRTGSPGQRVSAAWREAIDVLYEAGLAGAGELDALTSREIGDRTRARFDEPAAGYARTVGDAAERATFQTAVLVREDEVDEVWLAEHQLRRSVMGGLSASERLRAFGRFHRPRRTTWRRLGRRRH